MKQQKDMRSIYMGCVGNVAHLLVLLLIVLCLVAVVGPGEWSGYAISQYDGTDSYQEASWVLASDGEILDPHVELPCFLPLENGKYYTMTTTLTYDAGQDRVPYAFYYIHHMYTKAYLDGEEIFSYTPGDVRKMDRSKSPGNVYVAIPLPKDTLGREFTIEFTPPLSIDMDYELPYPTFGDYPTVVHSRFLEDLPHNLMGVLAGFVGILSILYVTVTIKGGEYREGLFMGLFALIFSIYCLTECPFNLYFFSNPYYTYFLNYATFSLMPGALLIFLREKFTEKTPRRILLGLNLTGVAMLLVEWALHFTGTLDMREFLPVIHGEYFLFLMTLLILVIRMKRGRKKKTLVLQTLPIVLGVLLDGFVYYFHWNITTSDAFFSSVGIVIFLLVELRHIWRSSIEIYMDSIRSRYYQEIAFEDKLTGVGNRRAFESEKIRLANGEVHYDSIWVVSADVNDLKQVNDTMGHGEGDYLIQSAAEMLSGIAEGCGKTFRTGGDEFILFLYNITREELEQKLRQARRHISERSQSGRAHLSVAIGYEPVEGLDLESAVQKADRKMYVNKGMQKMARESAEKE